VAAGHKAQAAALDACGTMKRHGEPFGGFHRAPWVLGSLTSFPRAKPVEMPLRQQFKKLSTFERSKFSTRLKLQACNRSKFSTRPGLSLRRKAYAGCVVAVTRMAELN
jgi:hypothetical protein